MDNQDLNNQKSYLLDQNNNNDSESRRSKLEKQKQQLLNKYRQQPNQDQQPSNVQFQNQTQNSNFTDPEIQHLNQILKKDRDDHYVPGQNYQKSEFQLKKLEQTVIKANDSNIKSKDQDLSSPNISTKKQHSDLIFKSQEPQQSLNSKNIDSDKDENEPEEKNENIDKNLDNILKTNQPQQNDNPNDDNHNAPKQADIQLYDPSSLQSSDILGFLRKPIPQGKTIQMQIKRDKSGFNRLYPQFYLYTNKDFRFIAHAKKQALNATSNYHMYYSTDPKQKQSFYIGKVRSNFLGTEFRVFDNGVKPGQSKGDDEERRLMAGCLYEQNLFGSKGPRKMKIILPEFENDEYYDWRQQNEQLIESYRNSDGKLKLYQNKPPKWNESFVLNFNGRVDKPSVKNFQLIDEVDDSHIYLQFGRQSEDMFSLDFTYPLSPLQAFGISLSSFDYKLACE